MGDIEQNQNDDNGNEGNQDNPGDLRAQLAAEKEKTRKLAAENATFKQQDQLRDLGFGHLNKRQQQTLLRDLADEGKELDEESVTTLAKEYGWPTEPPNRQPQGQPQGDPNGQNGQQQEDQNGDQVSEALSAIGVMQQANRLSAHTEVNDDFSNKIRKTKNKEELRDLIRSQGPRNRIVHEWDVP